MEKVKKYLHLLKNFKAVDKPHKKQKDWTPPGQGRKRFVMALIWLWIIGVSVVVISTIVGNAMADPAEDQQVTLPEPNPATQAPAIEFAKSFADTYFTWEATSEGLTERKEKLAPLLAAGLDEQAGLMVTGMEWNSTAGAKQIVAVKETGENTALITMKVEQVLTREVDEKKETERVQHLFTVPVGFAQAYGIYDLPNFSAVANAHELQISYLEGQAVDAATKENIANFLNTFFKSYTTDAPDSLNYFLDDAEAKGLEGSKELIEIRDTTAVQNGGHYLVETAVVLADPKTKVQYTTHYRLRIEQQGDKYMVTKLNEGVE